jgi:glucose/arabinose dehydrogenase
MAGVKLVPFGQQAAQQLIIELSDHFAAGLNRHFYVRRRAGGSNAAVRHRLRAPRNTIFTTIPFLRSQHG